MRQNLRKFEGIRKTFEARFVRYGTKTNFKGYQERTLLFKDVKCRGLSKINCDHVWFNETKQFKKLSLVEGDLVYFDARIKEYTKGYKGYREEAQFENPIRTDYRLSHPNNIKLIKNANQELYDNCSC